MEMFYILLQQTAIMFLLIACGFILKKKKMISEKGSADMANVLLYVATPALLINPFINPVDGFGQVIIESAILSLIVLTICTLISILIFKKDPLSMFACSFTNCGFMGLPLVVALFGNNGSMYLSMFIIISNILFWTIGVKMMSQDNKDIQIKKILLNPCIISFIVGLITFSLKINVGAVITGVFDTLSKLVTPLAMIILGIYLAGCDFKTLLLNKKSYIVCLVRLIIIPLICFPIILISPIGSLTTKIVVFIAIATPCATNTGVLAQKYNNDTRTASSYVCLSTLISLITLPILVSVINVLLQK